MFDRLLHRWILSLSALLLVVAPVAAQSVDGYTKLLVPVYVSPPVPGAFGSLWTNVLTGYYDGPTAPRIWPLYQRPCPVIGVPCDAEMLPQRMVELVPLQPGNRTSTFLFVHPDDLDDLTLQLRAQDLSRQSQTWGTELPVVPESEAWTGPLDLLNVPIAPEFRQTLRVYAFGPNEAAVEVRVYGSGGEENLFGSTVLTLAPAIPPTYPIPPPIELPAAGTIQWLAGQFTSPPLPQQNVRVRIVPRTEGLRFWAFISVTNNETQHVTTITPFRGR